MNNKQCTAQSTFLNLHHNEYIERLRYCPLAVHLDRCMESCNTFNDVSDKVCAQNKTEDFSLGVFNMIKGINESKILTKYISYERKL